MKVQHAVLLAGGMGTRAISLTEGKIPKALLEVQGRPFLEIKIESLIEMGIRSISILTGILGNQIQDFIERNNFDAEIELYHDGNQLLGTAGCIRNVVENLPDSFWITFADSLVRADLNKAGEDARNLGLSRIMTVFKNRDILQTSNTTILNNIVIQYEKEAKKGNHEWIDYGLLLLRREDFLEIKKGEKSDLGAILKPLVNQRSIYAFEVQERFWDVGDPNGFEATVKHFGKYTRDA